jgi:hypothetical protein
MAAGYPIISCADNSATIVTALPHFDPAQNGSTGNAKT